MNSTQKLIEALKAAAAPADLIARAERDEFNDFKSQSATPCLDLLRALSEAAAADPTNEALRGVRDQAFKGAFDATRAESDAWANSPEGRATLEQTFGMPGAKSPGKFFDMHSVPEDARISAICASIVRGRRTVVCIDDDAPKVARYLAKIRDQVPHARVVKRTPGPVKGVLTIVLEAGNPINN